MGATTRRRALALAALVSAAGCSTSGFFFEPVREYAARPDESAALVEEVAFRSGNGRALTGWVLKPRGRPPVASVLFLHGNYGNVSLMLFPVEPLVAAGFQVLTFDYQGYGRSEGEPSQENILADAQAALWYLRGREDLAGVPVVVFGQSMGGHLAVVLASRNPEALDALVVEGGYTGFRDIAADKAPRGLTDLLVPEVYRGLDEVGDVHVPLLVIHSVDDAVVPFWMGEALWAKANEPKTLWKVAGRHIRTAQLDPRGFVERFRALVDSLGR